MCKVCKTTTIYIVAWVVNLWVETSSINLQRMMDEQTDKSRLHCLVYWCGYRLGPVRPFVRHIFAGFIQAADWSHVIISPLGMRTPYLTPRAKKPLFTFRWILAVLDSVCSRIFHNFWYDIKSRLLCLTKMQTVSMSISGSKKQHQIHPKIICVIYEIDLIQNDLQSQMLLKI